MIIGMLGRPASMRGLPRPSKRSLTGEYLLSGAVLVKFAFFVTMVVSGILIVASGGQMQWTAIGAIVTFVVMLGVSKIATTAFPTAFR